MSVVQTFVLTSILFRSDRFYQQGIKYSCDSVEASMYDSTGMEDLSIIPMSEKFDLYIVES